MKRYEDITSINAAVACGHKIVYCSFTLKAYATCGWCWEEIHCCWIACTMHVKRKDNHEKLFNHRSMSIFCHKFNNFFDSTTLLDYLQWWSLETWSRDHFCESLSGRFQVSSWSQRQQVSVTSLLSWNCQYCKDMAL